MMKMVDFPDLTSKEVEYMSKSDFIFDKLAESEADLTFVKNGDEKLSLWFKERKGSS